MSGLKALRPDLSYSGSWMAVQIEPLPGSGERLTCCVAAIGKDERFLVRPVISTRVARCMYGEEGVRLAELVELISESLQRHLDECHTLHGWRSSFLHVRPTPVVKTKDRDLDGILKQAILQTASLGSLKREEDEESRQTRFQTAVRKSLVALNKDYKRYVNKSIGLTRAARPKRYGFVLGSYFANYTAISASSQSYDTAMARLIDLQDLRLDHFTEADRIELILAPPVGFFENPSTDNSRRMKQRELIEEAMMEASKRDISALVFETPDQVAMHIHQAVQA